MMMKICSTDQNKYELVKVENNDDYYDDDVFNQARKISMIKMALRKMK